MKNSRKIMSCLLSLSIVLSSQISASNLNNAESHYCYQKISEKNLDLESKNNKSLLSKLKNFIVYPVSLLIPPGILALIFGSKKIYNCLQSEKLVDNNSEEILDNSTTQVESSSDDLDNSDDVNQSQTSLLSFQNKDEIGEQEKREREEQERREREERNKYKIRDAINKANKIGEKLQKCVKINNDRKAMVSINGPTIIIGDLHGALSSAALVRDQVEKFLSESENNNAVFLGDYFNMKEQEQKYLGVQKDESFNVLDIITSLQIKYNNRVVLLRGNHEESYSDDFKNFKYFGKFTYSDYTYKYSANAEMIDEQLKSTTSTTIKDFCNSLPIAAEVTNNNQKILCLHGFIPSEGDSSWLDTLRNNKSSEISSEIKFPLLCNFYSETGENKIIEMLFKDVDGVCKDTLKKFLNENKYKCLVRGHSHNVFSNKDIFGDKSCYSVHSNTVDFYKKIPDSTAGILLFDNDGKIKTKIEYTEGYVNPMHDKRMSNLFEVPDRREEVQDFILEKEEKSGASSKISQNEKKSVLSVSPEIFQDIIKNYRGAFVFRGCRFESEDEAKKCEKIFFIDIEESFESNPKKDSVNGNYVYFAHNPYRALAYATRYDPPPISRVYLAYNLDDTVNNYCVNESVARYENDNGIIICNKPFTLNNIEYKEKYKKEIIRLGWGRKKFSWFRENHEKVEEDLKKWVTECIGEKNAETLWSYFSNDIEIEY